MKIIVEENEPIKVYPKVSGVIQKVIEDYNIKTDIVYVDVCFVHRNFDNSDNGVVFVDISWNDDKINGNIDFTIDYGTKEITKY